MSLTEYGTRIIEVLQANNVPFTMHWGKNGDWAYSGLLKMMYDKNQIEEWKACRKALLNDEMTTLFLNDFLRTIGLADSDQPRNEDLVASL